MTDAAKRFHIILIFCWFISLIAAQEVTFQVVENTQTGFVVGRVHNDHATSEYRLENS